MLYLIEQYTLDIEVQALRSQNKIMAMEIEKLREESQSNKNRSIDRAIIMQPKL